LSKGFSKWVYRLTLARWYYNYAWGWVIGYFLSTFTMIVTIYYLIPGLVIWSRFHYFSGAPGSEAHPQYQKALFYAEPEDTIVTEVFSENWPNAPHRVLRSSVEAAQAFKGEIVGQRRLNASGEMAPAKRFESFVVTRDTTGTLEAMPHWAGESVASVKKIQPAAELINELVSEAEILLHHWK